VEPGIGQLSGITRQGTLIMMAVLIHKVGLMVITTGTAVFLILRVHRMLLVRFWPKL